MSDRPLDAARARRALEAALPGREIGEVTHLGSGWATDVYRAGELVARFPRNAQIAAELPADAAILDFVSHALAVPFDVPEVVGRAAGGEHFPHPFLICTHVAGVGAADPGAPASDALAGEVGRVLAAIHSVPAENARAAGVGPVPWDASPVPLRFLHGDFGPDNLLVSPRTGRLVGVIDWGNAALGDPALDFVRLALWRGWAFVDAVVAAYGGPPDDGFPARLRRHARLQALHWLTDSVRRGRDPTLHLSWLRNAFGPNDDGG